MSTKSKLLAMTEGLQLPPDTPPEAPTIPTHAPAPTGASGAPVGPTFPGVALGATARTAPGQMAQFRGQMLAAEGELNKLRDQLRQHDGALPTRRLDPTTVVPSAWSNRHPDAFQTPEFQSLKQDIALAGGNVQAISVRPLADTPDRYEILFGHRRHRACLELGLPVLATIDNGAIGDLELFTAMDRENRERADLSPYEQGHMYRKALDAGLFPSNRRLAEALGVSHTWVNKVLMVADLPPAVLECFESPIVVQHKHEGVDRRYPARPKGRSSARRKVTAGATEAGGLGRRRGASKGRRLGGRARAKAN